MKTLYLFLRIGMLIGIALFPMGCGCGQKENGDHGHEKAESGGHEEEESPSGASFKPGKGIIFTEETSKILGVETVDVTEEMLPEVVQVNIQIFSAKHRIEDIDLDHSGCDIHGSGFLSLDKSVLVKPKQLVKLVTSGNETYEGFVVTVQEPLAHGEAEVIVGITTAGGNLKDGDFVSATISVPRTGAVTVIPSSALLRTAEGTYVYVVNGSAYMRAVVKVGSTANGKIEITDGLYPGDQVVTKPVETLWIIELRATKGGGHSH